MPVDTEFAIQGHPEVKGALHALQNNYPLSSENDIKNWKGNVKKSGFLPSERQWLTDLLASGWVDVVRQLHPDQPGPYAWWSWRGRAFDNDAGWRIDYQLATPGLAARAVAARVERAQAYALRWSDHAPVTVEYRSREMIG